MSFWDITALRTILDSETDSDSPNSEELMSQIRENIEALFLLMLKVSSGTATSDPPNDTTGYFEDTAAGFLDDEHNGRTLLITSGTAKGNRYQIDDTVAASNRVECTGDNLYTDGVRSGDSYIILYDLTSAAGHDHDGVNSAAGDFTAKWTYGSQVAITASTDIELSTSIPVGADEVVVLFNAVRPATAADISLVLGDSGGYEPTGYEGSCGRIEEAGPTDTVKFAHQGDRFILASNAGATEVYRGFATLHRWDRSEHLWTIGGVLNEHSGDKIFMFSGDKTLTGALDRIKLTSTSNFNASGEARVKYRS